MINFISSAAAIVVFGRLTEMGFGYAAALGLGTVMGVVFRFVFSDIKKPERHKRRPDK